MYVQKILVLIALFWQFPSAWSQVCDSCKFEVKTLEEPFPLAGQWLFTRDDRIENKDPGLDTSSWKLVQSPGNWNKVYADGKKFRVGWYRANFHFAADLVGKEVVVLVDTYLAGLAVYAQGELIFARAGRSTGQKYYAVQAVPLRFKISSEEMVFAMRVDTINMVGVYQQPFELEMSRSGSRRISYWHLFSGDMRVFSGFLCFITGLLFLYFYLKTHYPLYFYSSMALFGFMYFYAGCTDMLQMLVPPDVNVILSYAALCSGSLYLNVFASFFYKSSKRSMLLMQVVGWVVILSVASMAVDFNLDRIQIGRKLAIALSFLWAIHGCWMFWRCLNNQSLNRRGIKTLFLAYLFLILVGIHDTLVATSMINSVTLLFIGTFVVILAVIFVSSDTLIEAFLENKRLVTALRANNETLESVVAERTKEIKVILDHVQHGFLLVERDRRVAPSYSASCRQIFGEEKPEHQDFVDLLRLEGKNRSLFVFAYEQLCDNQLPAEVSLEMLPKRFVIQSLVYSLSANVIFDERGAVERILFSMINITLLEEMIQQDSKNRALLKILAHREAFSRFLEETQAGLERCQHLSVSSEQNKLRMELHTIKGNALIFGLDDLAKLIHIQEDQTKVGQNDVSDARKILELFLHKNESVLGLKENDGRHLLIKTADFRQLVADLESKTLVADCRDEIHKFWVLNKFQRARDLLGIIPEQMESLAKVLEKNLRILVVGGDVRLDPDWASPLFAQLPHLLRNAIDHGIETQAERAHKNPCAELRIEFSEDDYFWKIEVSDDGRGIDPRLIRERAAVLGMLPENKLESLEDEGLLDLIFHPGFSTRTEVTEVSGRGFGMSSLKLSLEKIGAEIVCQSRVGQGTRFTIRIGKTMLAKFAA